MVGREKFKGKKYLIIHADDAGLCHSENVATMEALEKGVVNSYSIMVACPWFYEMAIFAKEHPEYDGGVHLTLTCEWETYKFGPVLPVSEVPSLVDEEGHFYRKREQLRKYAKVEEVEKELEAQIEKAIRFGVKPTHIDSHMYSVCVSGEIFDVYRRLGKKYGLPVLISEELMEFVGLDPAEHIERGDLVVDQIFVAEYAQFENGKMGEYYDEVIGNLDYGLNVLLIHTAFDDFEMQGVAVNHPNFGAEWRQLDFDYFTSERVREKLKENGVELINWSDVPRMV